MFKYLKSLLLFNFFALFVFSNLNAQTMVDFGIDPGHGLTDFGACGMDGFGGTDEKHINLDIALEVEDVLVNSYFYTVIMTRTSDRGQTPHQKAEIVSGERLNPEGHPLAMAYWAVSIHANEAPGFDCSFPQSIDAWGQETYWSDDYWDYDAITPKEVENSSDQELYSQSVAYYAHHGLLDELEFQDWDYKDRHGIIQNDHLSDFLDHPREEVGTALIEVGFMSKQSDWDQLINVTFQEHAGYGIAKGLNDLSFDGDDPTLRSGELLGNETWSGNILAAGDVTAGPGERLTVGNTADVFVENNVAVIADGAGAEILVIHRFNCRMGR